MKEIRPASKMNNEGLPREKNDFSIEPFQCIWLLILGKYDVSGREQDIQEFKIKTNKKTKWTTSTKKLP